MPEKNKHIHSQDRTRHRLGNKHITIISVVLFVTVIAVTVFSQHYMSACIEREAGALTNRSELRKLGEQLAYSSDYLTEEAREYSLTGDIEHLYNYWYEVLVEKSRDKAVSELSGYNPPDEEQELLNKAKEYSDKLIETETLSMKLMLSGKGLTAEDYSDDEELYEFVKRVDDYTLPNDYASLSDEEKIDKSSEILYDYFYAESKTLILTPIDEFQDEMNTRLDNDVAEAENGIKTASNIQNVCSIVAVVFIAVLLILLETLYTRPLKEYTDVLESKQNDDLSKVRIMPKGSAELYKFAQVFDHLALMLEKELIRTEEAERRMSEAKTQAERANNAKSDFLAHMSHELRTPLVAITGYLYLLENTGLDEEQKEYCRSIGISSENLLGLINNVLDFSKIESGYMRFERADYDFHAIIDEIIGITRVQAMKKGLRLDFAIDEKIPRYVKGDSLRMKQVLINLCGNAVKFTDSGEIRLSVEAVEILPDKTVARLSVSDTGMGVSDEDKGRIFEPFVQSDVGITRKYGGTGLGLPISDMIVRESSEGRFHIEVAPNGDKGSVFAFNAYLYYGNAPQSDESGESICAIDDDVCILLVDDDSVNLEIERKILETYCVRVVTASNGRQAIKLSGEEDFSLIFLDLHMPELDGFETARRMRENPRLACTPIIALTADVVSGVEEKVLSAQMNGYLSKPFKPDKLKEVIAKYLDIVKTDPQSLVTESNRLFDRAKCLSDLDGDKRLLRELAERFMKKHKNSGEYIIMHIQNGDYANAGQILHDLKGVSGNLGCARLCRVCETLMKELHEKRCDSADLFADTWEKTAAEIKAYLDETERKEAQTEDGDFSEIFARLMELCESCDITAAEYFRENYGIIESGMNREDFSALKNMTASYELKAAYDRFGGVGK